MDKNTRVSGQVLFGVHVGHVGFDGGLAGDVIHNRKTEYKQY